MRVAVSLEFFRIHPIQPTGKPLGWINARVHMGTVKRMLARSSDLLEIYPCFSNKFIVSKTPQSLEKSVMSRIYGRGRGSVFSSNEFLDLDSRGVVDVALSRLVKKGLLRRLDRGVYAFPEKNRLIGELSPRPEEVAKALARRGTQKLLPSGAYAANLLGLTEQVPAKIEYLTDGPSRKAVIQKLSVVLKQTTPARLATAGRVSGTVAQALRFLRKEQVDDSVVEKLRKRLSPADKDQLLRDIPLVPAWVGEVFRRVAKMP